MNLLIDTHVLLWWLDDHPTPACPGTFTGSYAAGGAGRRSRVQGFKVQRFPIKLPDGTGRSSRFPVKLPDGTPISGSTLHFGRQGFSMADHYQTFLKFLSPFK
jgi:hypothetical protein